VTVVAMGRATGNSQVRSTVNYLHWPSAHQIHSEIQQVLRANGAEDSFVSVILSGECVDIRPSSQSNYEARIHSYASPQLRVLSRLQDSDPTRSVPESRGNEPVREEEDRIAYPVMLIVPYRTRIGMNVLDGAP
jgi:hypothetical protein